MAKYFQVKSEARQGCLLLPLLSTLLLEFLARAISHEKEIKGIGKKEICLFSGDMILTIKDPKEFTKKTI